MDPDDPYMVWYRRITRRLIGPPVQPPQIGPQPVASIREILVIEKFLYLYIVLITINQLNN